MVLDSELYEYSTKILIEEGCFENLRKTTELAVYTFFSPTDYRVKPSILFKSKKLIYVKSIGENGFQFFFPRE